MSTISENAPQGVRRDDDEIEDDRIKENVKEIVRRKYGEAALRVKSGGGGACCGGNSQSAKSAEDGAAATESACCDPITANLYDPAQAGHTDSR